MYLYMMVYTHLYLALQHIILFYFLQKPNHCIVVMHNTSTFIMSLSQIQHCVHITSVGSLGCIDFLLSILRHVLFSYHTPHHVSIVTASSPPPPPPPPGLTDAPYFTTIPASHTINSSTILQNMQCQATSNPGPPTIAWWSPSGQVLGVSGGSPVLGPLSGRDSGVYTCVATNAVGISTAGVSVTVLGGWSVCCSVGCKHAERVFLRGL